MQQIKRKPGKAYNLYRKNAVFQKKLLTKYKSAHIIHEQNKVGTASRTSP